ncbi:Ig-like domain repeat protein [Neobacillus sp. LXY-4]|uniref:Ig-like domain repeat protein n=1 Tax=Neobacillus sp. LXY-4 TaxID=3379826 RepID=UPI003EE22CA5
MVRLIVFSTFILLFFVPTTSFASTNTDSASSNSEELINASSSTNSTELGIEAPTIENTVTVTNVTQDLEPPVVQNIEVSPVEATIGEAITVKANVTDDLSEMDFVYASIHNDAAGEGFGIVLNYNEAEGKWVGTYVVESITLTGEYTVKIYAVDKAGNNIWQPAGQTVTVYKLDDDWEAPVIENIEVSSNAVTSGDQISIIANITDFQSGISVVWASLYSPNGDQYPVELTYDETTGKWVGTYLFGPTSMSGDWKVEVFARDQAGNDQTQYADQSISVANPDGDWEAPVIESIDVSPGTVMAGQELTISASITDNKSLSYVFANIRSDDGGEYLQLIYDVTSGKWVGRYLVRSNTSPSTLQIEVNARDAAGNLVSQYADQLVTVENQNGDWEAPVIENIEVSPSEASVGEEITIKADVTDNSSGMLFVSAVLYLAEEYEMSFELTYDETEGKWVGKYVVPQNAAPGEWNVGVLAGDEAGNFSIQNTDILVTINNPNGDWEKPLIENVEVTPNQATVGQDITIKAIVTDNRGLNNVIATLYFLDSYGYDEIALTYNPTEGKWVGSYLINSYAVPGKWEIEIFAADYAGNYEWAYADQLIDVVNQNGDMEVPVIESLTVSPGTVARGDEITIQANVTDNFSGIKSVEVYIMKPNGWDTVELTYDENQGLWVGTYLVNQDAAFGEWDFDFYTRDYAGNITNKFFEKIITIVDAEVVIESPKYGDAQWYYSVGNFYNAVYFAGLALAEGDKRPEVQDLMNVASAGLLKVAGSMSALDAKNSYELLVNTAGVPVAVKAEAENRLTQEPEVISARYSDAQWYYSVGNLYNAVYFVGLAIAEGDKRQEVLDLMNVASAGLLKTAESMSALDAKNSYELLVNTAGVPAAVKAEAENRLTQEPEIISARYSDAQWYYSVGNLYNAVYFVGLAIAEGDKRQEVQDLMNVVSASLLKTAESMSALDAKNSYELLVNTAGVPAAVKAEAENRLTQEPEIISTRYSDAQWYYSVGNLYNAVYFVGLAIAEGDKRQEVLDLMNVASVSLLKAAESMSALDAKNSYELLVNTVGVPATVKTEAESKLTPVVISARYGDAIWYYSVGNLYNAVYYAGLAIAEGDKRQEVQDFMNAVSAQLYEAAATLNEEGATYAYQLLANTTGVPENIKLAAEEWLVN